MIKMIIYLIMIIIITTVTIIMIIIFSFVRFELPKSMQTGTIDDFFAGLAGRIGGPPPPVETPPHPPPPLPPKRRRVYDFVSFYELSP